MRNFFPGVRVYDIAEQIYLLVGTRPFTFAEIAAAGVDATPGNLTRLQNRGIVAKLPKKSSAAGDDFGERPKTNYWILTPLAVKEIRRYQSELDRKEVRAT